MNILYFTYPINGLLMVLMPILLAIYLSRKFSQKWRLWWIGCVTFILSQVGHIPFNLAVGRLFELFPQIPESMDMIVNAAFLGLSAGLWEEFARYGAYRWWAKEARSWPQGLMMGAGHGGVEAILLGVLVLIGFINVILAGSMDLSSMLTPEQVIEAERQIQAYWGAPWPATLLGAAERLMAIILHLALSLLVMQVFVRRQAFWLWLAVLWHALVDAAAVYTISIWGPYETEAMLAGFALVSLAIIFLLRPSGEPELLYHEGGAPAGGGEVQAPVPNPPPLPQIEETAENLDETRFN